MNVNPIPVNAGAWTRRQNADLKSCQHSFFVSFLSVQRQFGKLQFHDLTELNGLEIVICLLSIMITYIYFFDSILHDISNDGYRSCLSKPQSSADSLSFYSGVPLRFNEMNTRGSCQVEPVPSVRSDIIERARCACFVPHCTSPCCHQKQARCIVLLELLDNPRSFVGRYVAVDADVFDSWSREHGFQEI